MTTSKSEDTKVTLKSSSQINLSGGFFTRYEQVRSPSATGSDLSATLTHASSRENAKSTETRSKQ